MDDLPSPDAPLGPVIRSHRERLRLSQEALADRSGVSVRTIRSLEQGRIARPRQETVDLLMTALGIGGRPARAAPIRDAAGPVRSAEQVARPATAVPSLAQLPPDVNDFTGRRSFVALIMAGLREEPVVGAPGGSLRGARSVVITGAPGVGKSALAIHVAWQLRDRFPDGQLFIDLRGTDPEPVRPAAVLGAFIRAFGLPEGQIPAGQDELTALYRSLLAEQRVLVILDNAGTEAQVRPLLAAGPGCATVVTARRALAGLSCGLRTWLPVLGTDEAVELAGRVIGADRVRAERDDLRRVLHLCDHLPLAIRIATAKLAIRPHWTVARLARVLDDELRVLDELTVGDVAVRASLLLSYQGADPSAAALFRLLAVVPAVDVTAWMAAALLDTDVVTAERTLDRLGDDNLLLPAAEDQAGQVRYRLHDLVRAFVRERCAAEESLATRSAALARLVRAGVTRAGAAAGRLRTGGFHYRRFPPSQDGVDADPDPLSWYDVERKGLLALVDAAYEARMWSETIALTLALGPYVELRAYWQDWESVYLVARDAARAMDDPHATAEIERGLAELAVQRGAFDQAAAHLATAGDLAARLDDSFQAAAINHVLGFVRLHDGPLEDSAAAFEEALVLFDKVDDDRGIALTRRRLAQVRRNQGEDDLAAVELEGCLVKLAMLGERRAEAHALRDLGTVRQNQRRFVEAVDLLGRGLAGFRAIGDRRGEVAALQATGETLRDAGELDAAIQALGACIELVREVGDPLWETAAEHSLADVMRDQGRFGEAADCLNRVLSRVRQHGDLFGEAAVLYSLGECHRGTGRFAEAVDALGAAAKLFAGAGFERDRRRAVAALADTQAAWLAAGGRVG